MNELTNDQVIHQLKNHLAIIVGFTDLLIADAPESDRRAADLREVRRAAQQAMAALPEIARRLQIATQEDQE